MVKVYTNEDHFFGSPDRTAVTLFLISECCNKSDCEKCPINEVCCQELMSYMDWLKTPYENEGE